MDKYLQQYKEFLVGGENEWARLNAPKVLDARTWKALFEGMDDAGWTESDVRQHIEGFENEGRKNLAESVRKAYKQSEVLLERLEVHRGQRGG